MDRKKKYYFHNLNAEEQKLCSTIVEAVVKRRKSVIINNKSYNQRVFQKIFDVINLDFPELFYFDISAVQIVYTGIIISIQLSYSLPDHVIKQYMQNIASEAFQFIDSYPSPIKRLKAIHEYLITSVSYEISNSSNFNAHTLIGPLIDKTGVCEGYAKAFKYLCERNEILCLVVTGEAISKIDGVKGPHAWNIVKVNGSCFHIDATWDSCFYHGGSSSLVYYMQPDVAMKCDHFWDINNVPMCNNTQNLPLMCNNKAELDQVIYNNLSQGNLRFAVRVSKKFNSIKEIIRQTEILLSGHPSIGIKSFKVFYIEERDQIEYTFTL